MRIAFITTGLEPGRDGVGDYTRDLLAACTRRGHVCDLIAINDRGVSRSTQQIQTARGMRMGALRLSASAPWAERLKSVGERLDRQGAEWVSLQFVPYGFDPKGLIGDLGARLAPLLRGRRLQLMFHELWIGAERGASWRHRVIGALQRRDIVRMTHSLQPAVMHTSNPVYRARLQAEQICAGLLPLCGSIPIEAEVDSHWLESEALRQGVSASRVLPRERTWWFGIFGSLHPSWAAEPLFGQIIEAARRTGRQIVIAAAGRQGPGQGLWRELQHRYGTRLCFVSLGERGVRDVSRFLQNIDYGVATTPWSLIGKSATVAAMLDHGLPVIVPRDDVKFDIAAEPEAEPLLLRLNSGLGERLGSIRRAPPRDRLAGLSRSLLADLGESRLERSDAVAISLP